MRKTLLFALLFILLLIFSSKIALAQTNTFTCEWGAVDSQPCSVNILPRFSDPSCDYSPGSPQQEHCAQYNDDEGECRNAAGFCQTCSAPRVCSPNSCASGYSPSTGTCTDPNSVCCLKDGIEPPKPDNCYQCIIESFGGNYCTDIAPQSDGTCGVYWEDKNVCVSECETVNVPPSFSCDTSQYFCVPAAGGKFTGVTAYRDCQSQCFYSSHSKIFCDSDGDATWVAKDVDGNPHRLYTALGCIFINDINVIDSIFLELAVGLAGGFALFLIIIGSVQIMTSAGDPQKVQAGRELITAAISGLLLLIFGVFMLRIIGINVLGIPGL